MNVGVFVSKYPYCDEIKLDNYYCGGSILSAHQLVNELSKKEINISVFTSSNDHRSCVEFKENVKIYRYATDFRFLSSNISLGIFVKPLKIDVDIIHTHFDLPPSPYAGYLHAKSKKKPLIITYHGDWDASYGNFFRRFGVALNNKLITDKILKYSKIIICPSEDFVDESKILNAYEEKIEIIPNGVNFDFFQKLPPRKICREQLNLPIDKKIILFVGSLYPHKGILELIRAMETVIRRYPDTILLVIGDGFLKKKLKQISEIMNINNNVIFLGYIMDKLLIASYYASSDIFVLPSHSESFGMALLEAAASGLPSVVSNLNAFNWIAKDGKTVLISNRKDPEDLADCIQRLLDNEELRNYLSINIKRQAKKFSWDHIADQTIEIYSDIYHKEGK